MTRQKDDQKSGKAKSGKSSPGKKAREAVESNAEDIRKRVRDAFVDAVRERRIDTKELREVARQVMDGAVEGVRSAAPRNADSVLREVADGLADGFSSAANATRFALEEAKGRGEQFAREDIDKAVQNLRAMEEMLVETISEAASRATDEAADQLKSLNEHAQRAGLHVRSSIRDALEAALQHPGKFAGEAASTGVTGVPRAAGHLLNAVSGLLQGAGDALIGETPKRAKARKSKN